MEEHRTATANERRLMRLLRVNSLEELDRLLAQEADPESLEHIQGPHHLEPPSPPKNETK